jgi:hypothetical protein
MVTSLSLTTANDAAFGMGDHVRMSKVNDSNISYGFIWGVTTRNHNLPQF